LISTNFLTAVEADVSVKVISWISQNSVVPLADADATPSYHWAASRKSAFQVTSFVFAVKTPESALAFGPL